MPEMPAWVQAELPGGYHTLPPLLLQTPEKGGQGQWQITASITTSKLEKINRELEKSEKKLRKAINDEKALQHQLKQLTRKERTHRLCTRGGMLESFLQEPERLTDDDVMLLLKLIFHRQDTQELLKKLLEREKPETP